MNDCVTIFYYPVIFFYVLYTQINNNEYFSCVAYVFVSVILLFTQLIGISYSIINDKLLLKNIPKSLKTIVASREYKQLSELKKSNYDLNIEYDY